MPIKKNHIKHTYSPIKMRLKFPRLRSSGARAHKAPKTTISEVEGEIEVNKAARVVAPHKDELLPTLKNDIETIEIPLETIFKKEVTLDLDNTMWSPENKSNVPSARDFINYKQKQIEKSYLTFVLPLKSIMNAISARVFEFNIQRVADFINYTRLKLNKRYLTFLLLALSIFSAVSVTGLLQSMESFNSSGILVETNQLTPPMNNPSAPPPEPRVEIDIYAERECIEKINSVIWGEIEANNIVTRVIYIKNAGDSEVTLSLLTDNWNPTEASKHIKLLWDYDGEKLRSEDVIKIILTLNVDESIPLLGRFVFDIIIVGSAL